MTLSEKKLSLVGRQWMYGFNCRKAKKLIPAKKRKMPGHRQYPGVKGKIVDWIAHKFEEGRLYIHIRFRDKTEVTFTLGSSLQIRAADLSDISTGDFKLIREYFRYVE